MEPSAEQISAVEAWLRQNFPAARIESGHSFDREVELFRIRDEKAPAPAKELEISDLAFEDHAVADIISALGRERAAWRLAQEPERRLFLTRELVLALSGHDPRR